MWTKLLWIAVGSAFGFGIAASFMYEFRDRVRSRGMAYFLCVVFVFVGAIVWGNIVSASVDAGEEIDARGHVATEDRPGKSLSERDKIIENIFLVTLIPALIGIRVALGKKPKPE